MADAEALGKERDSCIYGNKRQPVWLKHYELEEGVVKGDWEGSRVIQDPGGHIKGLEF